MQIVVFPLAVAKYTICSAFGDPRGNGTTHHGVDLCAPMGTPVLAVNNGVVRFGTDPKGGTVALLAADSGGTFYNAHLSGTEGVSGRRVEPGDIIGYVGMSGNAATTLPHLHFEAWPTGVYTTYIDPTPMLATAQRFTSPPGAAPGPMSTREAVGVAIGIVVAAGVLAFALSPPSKPARRSSARHA